MPPPDPERLFEQADQLAARPHEEDWRRAISAAYYGLFHFLAAAAADMMVGADKRAEPLYTLVYRSIDHGRMRALCSQLSGTRPREVPLMPSAGFGTIADFARIAANLAGQRNLADYDPYRHFTSDEARIAISEARQAIKWFQDATTEQQEAFLNLLLFKPR